MNAYGDIAHGLSLNDRRPVTREDVALLYQCLLGREPESERIFTDYMTNFRNPMEARRFILLSDEFLNHHDAMKGIEDNRIILEVDDPRRPPLIKRDRTLALAAIVKNEENNVTRMIQSCIPMADFILIADTGSTDRTREVAERTILASGIKGIVTSIPFRDFSQARNDALDLVPSDIDWVLMLDADEHVDNADHQKLLDLLTTDAHVVWLPRYNFSATGEIFNYPDYQRRLLRNNVEKPPRFYKPVHEVMDNSLPWKAAPKNTLHLGGASGGPHIHHLNVPRTDEEVLPEKAALYKSLEAQSVQGSGKVRSLSTLNSRPASHSPGTFDLGSVRTLHAINADRWLNRGRAYWLEWDHPNETPRPFASIIEGLEWCRWHQLIKPGAAAIDVGTHSADTTIPIGLFAYDKNNSKKGHVIGVEPNPDLHAIVESCYALNADVAHFYLEKCAITSQDVEEVELADHGNSNCNGGIVWNYADGLSDQLRKSTGFTYKARGKTLETIVREYSKIFDPASLQFIKTDCEGYDKEIIRSSKNLLAQLKPALFVEWFAWFSLEDSDDLFRAIDEAGYIPLHPHTLERITVNGERISDITCIHVDRIGELLP